MNISAKVKQLLLFGGLLLTFVVGIVILSSQKELSVNKDSKAATPSITATPEITTTPTLTVTPSKAQDVPLKVLGTKQDFQTSTSYLYTELISKGIISNITANSASIIWLTEAPQKVTLQYGASETQLHRKVEENSARYLHHLDLTELLANQSYYYTGHAPIVDSFTTPSALPAFTSPSTVIQGEFTQNYGECIVRVSLSRTNQASAYATAYTTATTWSVPLRTLRTTDLANYYVPQLTDSVEIDSLCVKPSKGIYSGIIRTNFKNISQSIVSVSLPLLN